MSVNIYDNANEMAKVLTQTEQYQAWETAFNAVQDDEKSKDLFKKFQTIQMTVQQMMQAQKTPTSEQEKEWDETAKEVQADEKIKNLMSAEQVLNTLLGEVNDIVTKPVSESYAAAHKA
ncbi:YlbF family regulator [Fructobacillus sp. CRL 2054]|uniref:YlbF family regulator n=1 Tax=Fructobacillus sp. CRL 2054 TaxID=2763007 RepID=UPI0023792B60|nr:YlbF family regulator [Fructobacillus sp. CRL 2054]MDD9139221.1 YlbF family regulator [Fructobacillus sp. CRL 2054]